MKTYKHKIRRTLILSALVGALVMSLAGCDTANGSHTGLNNGTQPEGITGDAEQSVAPDTIPEIPETEGTPMGGDYTPTGETVITLGDTIAIEGGGAVADGQLLTITAAGQYLISGTLTNGQIVVDTQDTSKVELILNGVSVTSTFGPAVYVKSAPKRVVLTTAKESVNLLADGNDYLVPDDQQAEGGIYPNACMYACDDLTVGGGGTLRITGNADKGINTKDDLKIEGGTIVVQSVGAGVRANDSLSVLGGEVHVTSGGDGMKTANTETEGKGQIDVQGGALYITATGDGLSAATDLTVSGGTVVIETKDADGSALGEAPSIDNPGNNDMGIMPRRPGGSMGGGPMGGGMMEGNSNKSTISAKGLKAVGTLTISGGKITITAVDDGLHSDGSILVTDGSVYIRSADDGMHAEDELTIRGGVTEIAQSYEGLEALHISIEGGTNRVTASDDGTNASGGTSSGGMGGGMFPPSFGQWSTNTTASEDTPCVTISGGYTVINASGDGLDSNGSIVMTGGTVLVYGPTNNGNGPIDIGDGGFEMTVSGGLLLAVGSSGMAEAATNAGQAVLAATMRSGLSAGESIGIAAEDGSILAVFKLPKAISSIVFSSSDLTEGTSYSVIYGGTIADGAEVTDGVIPPESYTDYTVIGSIQAN